jgi:hypothetical protein
MHRFKRTLSILIGLVLLLGVAGLEAYVSQRHEAAIVPLDADCRRVRAEIQQVERELAVATRSLADYRARSPAPRSSSTPARSAPANPRPNFVQVLRDNPELQNLQLAARRAGLFITHAPLYRKLELDPAKMHALEAAILEREEKTQDIGATVLSGADAVLAKKMIDQVNADYAATVQSLLGESAAQAVHEYERRIKLREMVAGYAGTTAMAGIPFTASQAEQLTDALAVAAPLSPHRDEFDYQRIDWARVHEQAKSFLTPAQLTFIETTEPRMGGRFLGQLNAILNEVIRSDTDNAVH